MLFIVAGVIAFAVAVTAVIILMSDGGGGDDVDLESMVQPVGAAAGDVGEVEEAPTPVAPEEERVVGGGVAAASLTAELQSRRLWSSVEIDGATAVVHTAFCNDPGMEVAVQAAGADLIAAGITAVRCHERHGPVAFERPLEVVNEPAGDAAP